MADTIPTASPVQEQVVAAATPTVQPPTAPTVVPVAAPATVAPTPPVKQVVVQQPPQPKPMDWPAALKHLLAIEQKAMMTHGKEGHNPIIWCRDNIRGIQAKLEAGDKSREVYDSIMALQLDKVDTSLVKKTSHDVGQYKRPIMETVTIVQEKKV